jgi:hypothetical protein
MPPLLLAKLLLLVAKALVHLLKVCPPFQVFIGANLMHILGFLELMAVTLLHHRDQVWATHGS